MSSYRTLIVNADDFGRSAGINSGIVHACEHGVVTSASLMVCWPTAPEAAAYSREHPNLSLGLHVDLGEWVYRDETWVLVKALDAVDSDRVYADTVRCAAELCGHIGG